jgi:hypothetical protein
VDQATQHFQCGGFAGAIGPQETHHLAGRDLKRHVLHGHHISGAAPNEMTQGACQTGLLLGNPVNLAEPFDLDQNGGQRNVLTLRENSIRDRSLSKSIDLILLIQIGTLSTAMTQE